MISSFHALELAKRGLFSQQTALTTTGHNIANANTPGYSRQRVNLVASSPFTTPGMNRIQIPGQLGTGVTFDSITRIRESFLDDQFRKQAQSLGNWQIKADTLEKIENIFNEPSDVGFRTVIDNFWNAWQDVSSSPDIAASVLKERALAMIDTFKHIDTKLSELSQDLTTNIDLKVSEVNTYLTQIASLNQEIRRIEGLGNNANDLRDQRDLIVDHLSQLIDVQVAEDLNGMYNVSLSNGTALVQGIQATLVGDGVGVDQITGGEIAGMVASRDQIVNEYQAQLDAMFKGLIFGEVNVRIPEGSVLPVDVEYGPTDNRQILQAGQAVPAGGIEVTVKGINGLHQLGWTFDEDANGNAIPGGPFFLADEQNFSIQNVQLHPDIVNNLDRIAVSWRVEDVNGVRKVIKGNNHLALAMGQLRDAEFSFTPTVGTAQKSTFDQYFRSVTGALGVQAQEANRQTANQALILHQVENKRQSVSGVSLDEEMANMIKFQHAYNASARMMTTIDQSLDTIINRMGLVGR